MSCDVRMIVLQPNHCACKTLPVSVSEIWRQLMLRCRLWFQGDPGRLSAKLPQIISKVKGVVPVDCMATYLGSDACCKQTEWERDRKNLNLILIGGRTFALKQLLERTFLKDAEDTSLNTYSIFNMISFFWSCTHNFPFVLMMWNLKRKKEKARWKKNLASGFIYCYHYYSLLSVSFWQQ